MIFGGEAEDFLMLESLWFPFHEMNSQFISCHILFSIPNQTILGNKLEIDQQTYASSTELNKHRDRRWVNPGTMMPARVKARKSPFIEYDRTPHEIDTGLGSGKNFSFSK